MQLLNRFTVPNRVRLSNTAATVRSDHNGSFYFNQLATELIGLNAGDRLNFFFDKELYVTKTISHEGFPVKFYSHSVKKGAVITSIGLRRKMMYLCNIKTEGSFVFEILESQLEATPFIKWLMRLEDHHG